MEVVYKKRKNKKEQQPVYKNLNSFKIQQKKYKLYQNKQTDFSQVNQLLKYDNINGFKVAELNWPKGAYLVKNFVSVQKVIQVGFYGLNVFCNRPYRTNLDGLDQLYQQQKLDKQQQKLNKQQQILNKQQQILKKQQIIENKQQQSNQLHKINNKSYFFNDKIRWANVGYQYDWSQRKYPSTKTQMHHIIQQLSFAANKLYNSIKKENIQYNPESAIINYYSERDYMTGHLDDAQIDQISPIYSFSFGLSCIFLIGGETKDEKPTALRLQSGDLLIMSGNSRKSYHGVPRILSDTYKAVQEKQEQYKDCVRKPNGFPEINNYFLHHRININIRQVYPQIQ